MAAKTKKTENENLREHPIVLLAVYLGAKKRGDEAQAESAKTKLAQCGIFIGASHAG